MNPLASVPPIPVWEDLVSDLLEISCSLDRDKREFLIEKMREEGLSANAVRSHFSFSIDGHLMVFTEGVRLVEVWLYDRRTNRIRKFRQV